jgi:hypothetical protein
MMDGEERTTKYAEGAKRETTLLFKEKSYKIVGGCFEVYKEKGSGFFRGRVPGMSCHGIHAARHSIYRKTSA